MCHYLPLRYCPSPRQLNKKILHNPGPSRNLAVSGVPACDHHRMTSYSCALLGCDTAIIYRFPRFKWYIGQSTLNFIPSQEVTSDGALELSGWICLLGLPEHGARGSD